LRSEKITLLKIAGLLTAIGGATLLILGRENSVIGSNMLLGDIFIIINAVFYAFYYVLVKPLMQKYSPIHVVRWVFTFGLVLILPFCWGDFRAIEWSSFTTMHVAALAFVVIGATFLAYYFTAYGLQHLSASAVGAYIYLQPLFSAIISILYFHEALTATKLIAAVLIFTGVFLVNKKKNAL
jgi:drug/metabolite transporter (DMT)-like permease